MPIEEVNPIMASVCLSARNHVRVGNMAYAGFCVLVWESGMEEHSPMLHSSHHTLSSHSFEHHCFLSLQAVWWFTLVVALPESANDWETVGYTREGLLWSVIWRGKTQHKRGWNPWVAVQKWDPRENLVNWAATGFFVSPVWRQPLFDGTGNTV